MTRLTVFGLDPGLGMTGYALAAVDPVAGTIADVFEVGIIQTQRTKLRAVRKTSDDLRRAREHVAALRRITSSRHIDIVAAEMVTITPYTYPTFSFGVMTGILAGLEQPIVEVLPYEVKVAATGNERAGKQEIIEWALGLPSSAPVSWPSSPRTNRLGIAYRGEFISKAAEHPADALAVIQAALRTEQFRLAMRLNANMSPWPERLEPDARAEVRSAPLTDCANLPGFRDLPNTHQFRTEPVV